MIVMQEDGTPVITDSEGNIVQQDLIATGADTSSSSKLILGADGSISLDQLGDVQSITPITSTIVTEAPPPIASPSKSHPKFVVTSSGLQIQSSQASSTGTNGSPVTTSTAQPQVSLLRQAFNNASPDKPQFITVTPQPQPPPPAKVHVPAATITIPAAKPIEKPIITETSVSNGHSILVSTPLTQSVNTPSTVLAVPQPGPEPGPELMETDTLTGNTWESTESEEVSTDQPESQSAPLDSVVEESVPADVNGESSLPVEVSKIPEPMEAETTEFEPSEVVKLPEPEDVAEEAGEIMAEPEPSEDIQATTTQVIVAKEPEVEEPEPRQEAAASIIINIKKVIGEAIESSKVEEKGTTTVVEATQVTENTVKGGLNDSTSSFKTGEYGGNSEDDDDPADYYQNVDPIDSYLNARDEEDGIPAESLTVASPQKEPIDYESVFPSPQKREEARALAGAVTGQQFPRRRGRPPKKSGIASPRVSSASDSENTSTLSPSKRSQRQGKSIYRRPFAGSPDTSTTAKDVSATDDSAVSDEKQEEPSAMEHEPVSDKETMDTEITEASKVSDVEVPAEAPIEIPDPVTPIEVPVKRGRGRPRKSLVVPVQDSTEDQDSSQAETPEVATVKPTPKRRGRPPKKSIEKAPLTPATSEADDSQNEGREGKFERIGAVRGRGRKQTSEKVEVEKLEPEKAETSQSEELEEGEIDFKSIQQTAEEFEPQPGTSREMSRTGRQRSAINYREMAGSTDADTASDDVDDSDAEEEEKPTGTPAKRRGRPRKEPKKSPMKTYDMRKYKGGLSPVKSSGKTLITVKSPHKGSPLKISESYSPTKLTGKDGKEWRGEISSLRKEIEGLRSTNDQLQTKLEMTDQQVQSGDSKELHFRIEKLQTINTDLKNKLKEAESRVASASSAPKFSLNLGLFKGPKFDKFTVKKGSSQNTSSSASGSDNRADRPDGVLARQKDQLGAMNKDLKNKEALLEKREHKARALDQELDDRSSQLKVKEAKLNRWEQKLKSHQKELEYRERNLNRSEKSPETTGRKSGDTEKKLREMFAKKDRCV